jgi:hypothetical protein
MTQSVAGACFLTAEAQRTLSFSKDFSMDCRRAGCDLRVSAAKEGDFSALC